MDNVSYATARKVKQIEAKYGSDWTVQFPNRSIDSIFIELTGDHRKNLFCKIDPDFKQMLDEMVEYHQLNMAEMVERIIENYYARYANEKKSAVVDLTQQYSR